MKIIASIAAILLLFPNSDQSSSLHEKLIGEWTLSKIEIVETGELIEDEYSKDVSFDFRSDTLVHLSSNNPMYGTITTDLKYSLEDNLLSLFKPRGKVDIIKIEMPSDSLLIWDIKLRTDAKLYFKKTIH